MEKNKVAWKLVLKNFSEEIMNFNETLKSNGTKHMVPLTSYHLIRLAKDRKWARETLSSDRLCVQKVYKHSRNSHKKSFP